MTSITITQKRLQNELKLLKKNPLDLIDFFPEESNIFTWYFIVKGPEKTDYEGGFFIGQILISQNYPKTPVDFKMLTPNGRFEIEKKICLTNSGYHSEEWSPIWNMSTIMLGFLSIMADDSTSGLNHIKKTPSERKELAKNSFAYNVTKYPHLLKNFTRFVNVADNGDIRMRTDTELKSLAESSKKSKKDKKEVVVTQTETETPTVPKSDPVIDEINNTLPDIINGKTVKLRAKKAK